MTHKTTEEQWNDTWEQWKLENLILGKPQPGSCGTLTGHFDSKRPTPIFPEVKHDTKRKP